MSSIYHPCVYPWKSNSSNATNGIRMNCKIARLSNLSAWKSCKKSYKRLPTGKPSFMKTVMAVNDDSMSEDFVEDDPDFITASVLEAVEVCSSRDGFSIRLSDGRQMKCEQNAPNGAKLSSYPPQPAMVLKMEEMDLMLPIIVLEQPSILLMEAIRRKPVTRPTIYQVIRDMVELMGHEVKLVRITHRVCESYHARIYLAKAGGDSDIVFSLDLRPSDAINLAVRAKVPIQVSRQLALGDGVRLVAQMVQFQPRAVRTTPVAYVVSDADRAGLETCTTSEEFQLVAELSIAAQEERYTDAAELRDELNKLRQKKKVEQD